MTITAETMKKLEKDLLENEKISKQLKRLDNRQVFEKLVSDIKKVLSANKNGSTEGVAVQEIAFHFFSTLSFFDPYKLTKLCGLLLLCEQWRRGPKGEEYELYWEWKDIDNLLSPSWVDNRFLSLTLDQIKGQFETSLGLTKGSFFSSSEKAIPDDDVMESILFSSEERKFCSEQFFSKQTDKLNLIKLSTFNQSDKFKANLELDKKLDIIKRMQNGEKISFDEKISLKTLLGGKESLNVELNQEAKGDSNNAGSFGTLFDTKEKQQKKLDFNSKLENN